MILIQEESLNMQLFQCAISALEPILFFLFPPGDFTTWHSEFKVSSFIFENIPEANILIISLMNINCQAHDDLKHFIKYAQVKGLFILHLVKKE